MEQLLLALVSMAAGVGACVLYFWGTNKILDGVFPARGPNAGRNILRANSIRPWLFLGPAIALLTLYLIYPVINSVILSFYGPSGQSYVGTANYSWLVSDAGFRESLRNNLLWLFVVPAASTFFGLIAAALTDRISWGNIAKSLIFMPMAISFVGASVIWKFVYDIRGENIEQIGLLNAIVVALGGEPQAWITLPFWNNVFL
ncbi:MAG: sugar ABC transporter permease, partial [Roseibium sp.]